jgi:hypothetical protein
VTATLRVVLDQLVAPTTTELAEASRELTRALVAAAPRGADVGAIVPRGEFDAPPGLADVTTLMLPRRELAASWPLGVAPGVGPGLIHAPTLLAPLVKHDRVHETHQIVVTLWDLRPWQEPDALPRAEVLWHRAMLKRAQKHADAIVVPTHAMAETLAQIAPKAATRVRVIAGAPPADFRVPTDAAGRLRTLGLPGRVVVLDAPDPVAFGAVPADATAAVFVADAHAMETARAVAAAAGVAADRVIPVPAADRHDRAAVLSVADAFVATSRVAGWPWRGVEALAAGVPVAAVDTPTHREVFAEAAVLSATGDLRGAVAAVRGPAATRLRVLASDRGRSFSWREAAERTWALHAEL